MLKHPTYNHFGPQISKIVARKQLGIPDGKKVLLFFGFIRHYKGLDLFLNILQEIRKKIPDIYLVVAGECFGSFESYQMIINANCLEEYIKCDIKYIQNSLIPIYFSSADIFLMPYRSATNSWVMEIAKYYKLPILASSIEAFKGQSDYHVNLVNMNNAAAVIWEINNIYTSGLDRVNNDLTWEKFSQEIVRLI